MYINICLYIGNREVYLYTCIINKLAVLFRFSSQCSDTHYPHPAAAGEYTLCSPSRKQFAGDSSSNETAATSAPTRT